MLLPLLSLRCVFLVHSAHLAQFASAHRTSTLIFPFTFIHVWENAHVWITLCRGVVQFARQNAAERVELVIAGQQAAAGETACRTAQQGPKPLQVTVCKFLYGTNVDFSKLRTLGTHIFITYGCQKRANQLLRHNVHEADGAVQWKAGNNGDASPEYNQNIHSSFGG